MFDKTPHAMALLGTFQQECAEAIGSAISQMGWIVKIGIGLASRPLRGHP